MRLYQKKLIRKLVKQETAKKREIRNGIIWSVDDTERVCRVKIQGSNQQVVAWYPENWEKTPVWLKPGNAVTILHQGNRGRIEVIGHGQVVPSPVAGGDPFPDMNIVGDDYIVSGLQITATNPPSMDVIVHAGVVRFNGLNYDVPQTTVTIATAPTLTTRFRYDIIVIGSDLVIDYIQGTESSSDPSEPSVPSGHLKIGRILVQGGQTSITYRNIGIEYSNPDIALVGLTINDDDLAWNQLTTQMTATALDQYGNQIRPQSGSSYTFELEFMRGNGQLYSTQSGWNSSLVTQTTSNSAYVYFTYKRNQTVNDISPGLSLTLTTSNGRQFIIADTITLRDESGNIMW